MTFFQLFSSLLFFLTCHFFIFSSCCFLLFFLFFPSRLLSVLSPFLLFLSQRSSVFIPYLSNSLHILTSCFPFPFLSPSSVLSFFVFFTFHISFSTPFFFLPLLDVLTQYLPFLSFLCSSLGTPSLFFRGFLQRRFIHFLPSSSPCFLSFFLLFFFRYFLNL